MKLDTKIFYHCSAYGVKYRQKSYNTEEKAKYKVYKAINKKGLTLKEIYKDEKTTTFVCGNGVRFFIQKTFY